MVGPRSRSSCLSSGPQSPWPSALPGITAWLPWCTTASACGPTTSSTTVSPSTTLQVFQACPLSLQHPQSLGSPTLLGRQHVAVETFELWSQIWVRIQTWALISE